MGILNDPYLKNHEGLAQFLLCKLCCVTTHFEIIVIEHSNTFAPCYIPLKIAILRHTETNRWFDLIIPVCYVKVLLVSYNIYRTKV